MSKCNHGWDSLYVGGFVTPCLFCRVKQLEAAFDGVEAIAEQRQKEVDRLARMLQLRDSVENLINAGVTRIVAKGLLKQLNAALEE